MNEDSLLTADELAERLRVQPGTVRQWSRAGRIPAVRLSPKVVRYDLAAVIEALTQRQASSGGLPRAGPRLRAVTVRIAQGVDRLGPIWEQKSGKGRIAVGPCPGRGGPTIEIRARGGDDPVPRRHASRRLRLTPLRTREIVEKVFVPEKSVVTFKPGQVVQQRVEALGHRK